MKRLVLIRILALLLGIVALSMLPSLALSLQEGNPVVIKAFGYPIAIFVVFAALAAVFGRNIPIRLNGRDGFLIVALSWGLCAFLGAAPFVLAGVLPSWADGVFEASSGFTTTGASVFTDVEVLPRSILFWRAMTHWLGGMGIVVLTVALLPLLGVGGFQLLKAETPGPEKDKVAPKITATAKILWYFYIGFTIIQIVLLMFGGMDWFDATTHSFATMATGGFSTKNTSVGYYKSAYIEIVITTFMVIAGANFSLYYRLLQGKFSDLWYNSELRAYLLIFFGISAAVALAMLSTYHDFGTSFRYAAFQVASILTTTGFMSTDYDQWNSLAKSLIMVTMFIGGCAGSTGGGIKVVRIVVLFKQTVNEIRRLLYPRGVFSIRLNGKVGRRDVVYGTAGFVALYMALIFFVMLVVASSGADLITSLSGSLATVGNIGPGFNAVGPAQNYSAFPAYVKWVFSFGMIAGRLELWTIFILFTRAFWRK